LTILNVYWVQMQHMNYLVHTNTRLSVYSISYCYLSVWWLFSPSELDTYGNCFAHNIALSLWYVILKDCLAEQVATLLHKFISPSYNSLMTISKNETLSLIKQSKEINWTERYGYQSASKKIMLPKKSSCWSQWPHWKCQYSGRWISLCFCSVFTTFVNEVPRLI
jgi:hypothetical protein